MKKVLSLVLVIAMVLSSMSFAFAADTFEDVEGDYERAINALNGLGIITGYEDGTFRPERSVTRAEMAKLMVEILGYGDLVAGAKSNFTDTQGHWADQWIAIAAGRNIVIGIGDGRFLPDAQVSYDQVLTMIVRGLGYTDDSNEIKAMTWPTNFKVKAAEIGVTDGVKMSVSGADRGGVAQALFNALGAALVTVDTDGNVTSIKDGSDTTRTKELITRIAQVKSNKRVGNRDVWQVLPKHLDVNSVDYAGNTVDLLPYLYEYVEAYSSRFDNTKIVYVGESFSDVTEGTFVANHNAGDNAKHANNKFQVEKADETKKLFTLNSTSSPITVYYNGKVVSNGLTEADLEKGTNEIAALGTTKSAKVKVVSKNADLYDADDVNGDVRAIVVTNPTFADKVITSYKEDALKIGRIQLPKKGDNVDLSKVTVTGAVDDIKDIEAGDVVVAYAAGGLKNNLSDSPSKTKLVVVRDTVEGTITKVNESDEGSTTIYVDGVKYKRSGILGRTETFNVGYEGTFFFDDAGKLFAADATDIASAKDYAVVIEPTNGYKVGNTSTGTKLADATIKLINASGEVVTYNIDKDAKFQDSEGKLTENKVLNDTLAIQATYGTIGSRTLIKYNLDGNAIDSIQVVDVDVQTSATYVNRDNVDTDSSKFEVAKDAPIFSVKTGADTDKDGYSVVEVDNLPSSLNLLYADFTDGGQYKVIVSNNADRTTTGTYALITGVNYVLDGNKKVAEITGYVDGKVVTYLGKSNFAVASSLIDTDGNIASLAMSGGKVTVAPTLENNDKNVLATTNSAIYVSGIAGINLTLKTIDGNVSVGGNVPLNSDNLTIYVLNAKGEFDYVEETAKSIVGLKVIGLYDVDATQAGVEIIVVQ